MEIRNKTKQYWIFSLLQLMTWKRRHLRQSQHSLTFPLSKWAQLESSILSILCPFSVSLLRCICKIKSLFLLTCIVKQTAANNYSFRRKTTKSTTPFNRMKRLIGKYHYHSILTSYSILSFPYKQKPSDIVNFSKKVHLS